MRNSPRLMACHPMRAAMAHATVNTPAHDHGSQLLRRAGTEGATAAAVPRITPACVIASDMVGDMLGLPEIADGCSAALAKPKSSTLTTPSDVILMLAGFR